MRGVVPCVRGAGHLPLLTLIVNVSRPSRLLTMKLVTYLKRDDPSVVATLGALTADEASVVDLQQACISVRGKPNPHFADMIAFLTGGAEAQKEAKALLDEAPPSACHVPMASVKLLAPLRPRTMRDTACYEGHLVNCARSAILMRGGDPTKVPPEALKPPASWFEMPLFYKSNLNAIVGHDEDVAFPEGERFKDYELELAVVIGKQGKNINAKRAMQHVAGYTIFNDFSARLTQLKEMPSEFHVGPGVSKDFANGLGPCIVTADCFDPLTAETVVRVNGQVRTTGTTGGAYHSIERVIEYVSNNTTLYPGDVIAMGTVANGSGLEILKPLKIDDVLELEIKGIGILRNKIVPCEVAKISNRFKIYKRYVCATTETGKSEIVIDDYPDITRNRFVDLWLATEMPMTLSATATTDLGNEPWSHEAPHNGSTFRWIELNADSLQLTKLSALPMPQKQVYIENVQDVHREIGTHYIPTAEDMSKHLLMHKTDSINLFVCLGGAVISLNDQDDIELQPGDAFIQLGSMHAWSFKGDPPCYVGGLLVDGDVSTARQLEVLPQPALKSKINRFKRYVSGTVKSDTKAIGVSKVLIDDFAPNESEIVDPETGKTVGWAGDIWRTFAPQADISGAQDTITGPMENIAPKGGINFRMVELVPGGKLASNPEMVNYYSVIKGELTARSEGKMVVVGKQEHLVQLRAKMVLENAGGENVLMAHYMLDAAAAK